MFGKEYAVFFRLETNILIGTSVLNCQALKTLFLLILVIKTIFSRELDGVQYYIIKVILTCDKRYNTFDLKNNDITLY